MNRQALAPPPGRCRDENRYPVVALVPRLHTGYWLKRLRRKDTGPNLQERIRAVNLGLGAFATEILFKEYLM